MATVLADLAKKAMECSANVSYNRNRAGQVVCLPCRFGFSIVLRFPRFLFPSAGYELVQHLRRCGVRRADLVCVDRDRGLRIGVSEPFGDRFHVYAVCDHQRGVCVPQRMQMDRRQVVSPHKSAEPGRNAVRVKGFTELVCKYVSHTMIKVAVSQTCFLFNLQRRGCTVLSDDTVQFSASKVFNASSRSVQFHAPYSFGRKQAKNKKPFP